MDSQPVFKVYAAAVAFDAQAKRFTAAAGSKEAKVKKRPLF